MPIEISVGLKKKKVYEKKKILCKHFIVVFIEQFLDVIWWV